MPQYQIIAFLGYSEDELNKIYVVLQKSIRIRFIGDSKILEYLVKFPKKEQALMSPILLL